MAGIAIIVFRETVEAALVICLLAAATRGLAMRGRLLAAGASAGVLGALFLAGLAGKIADWAEGTGQELVNAGILGVAVLLLSWHLLWMSRHGAELAAGLRTRGEALRAGAEAPMALVLIAGVTVLREGAETVLFVHGLAAGSNMSASTLIAGTILGLLLGGLAGGTLYTGFLAFSIRRLLAVTGVLIALLAAGMAGRMANLLVQADRLPAWGAPLWDTSAVLSNASVAGDLLAVLAGYNATPSGMQLVFQGATLAVLAVASIVSLSSRTSAPIVQGDVP